MTEEVFERVTKIYVRIKSLEEVKSEINSSLGTSLNYVDNEGKSISCIRYNIKEYLDRHNVMILEDIDKEIESLKEEISKL